MELTEDNLNGLRNYLEQTLSADANTRKNAEAFLKSVEVQPGYPILVLKVIEQSSDVASKSIRQAASVLFKNYIVKHWDPEKEKVIADQDRVLIKTNLVHLMCSMPEQIQKQLSAALSTIGQYDFPHNWDNLLPELVSKLNGDWCVINGVLQTANTIFKRFRNVFRSDELYKELKHCLEHFQQPLLDLMKITRHQIASGGQEKGNLVQMMMATRSICRIFYSLNWQDLPAFFEDHIDEWMNEFIFFLQYDNALLVDADEEDESSVLDVVQEAVVENLNLYIEKYEDEFKPYLEPFGKLVLQYLSNKLTIHPKHDALAAGCMKYLRAIGMASQSKAFFEQPGALEQVCNQIVVRNLQLRTSDEELFEDNPMDFIRRDIEGSDGDTRRSAARDLVRGLLRHFHGQVTQICLGLVQSMLAEYAKDPANKWRLKDVSINLVIAIAVQKQSKLRGVSELNAAIPIMDFFSAHIAPEMAKPNDDLKMLKAGSIKFVSTFRNQLTADMMQQLVPMLIQMLVPNQFVVHTYAASCLERLLTVKEANGQLRYGAASLTPSVPTLLQKLFGILEQPNYPENDYLMKTVMRIFHVAKENIVPFTDTAVSKLTTVLKKICANPTNPTFAHYLFESISVLILNVCKTNPAATEQFENLLFPPFQSILSADIELLSPYVYQVLALMLELRQQGVSQAYMSMFPILLTPALWERNSNVTALVKLMEAYLHKCPEQLISYLQGILGVFQKLISSKTSESNAFTLLRAFFGYLPLESYTSFLKQILQILMMRLQSRMGARMGIIYVKDLIYSLSVFIGKHGPAALFEALEGIQAGMGRMVLEGVWLKEVLKIRGTLEKKTVAVSMVRVLCEYQLVMTDDVLWVKQLTALLLLLEEKDDTTALKDADDELAELEETGYEAGFSKLYFASATSMDIFSSISCPKKFLVSTLSTLSSARPGHYLTLVQNNLDPKQKSVLESYFASSKFTFN